MKSLLPLFILSFLSLCTLQSFQVYAETDTETANVDVNVDGSVQVGDELTDKKLQRQCARKARDEKCNEPEVSVKLC